MCATPRLNLSNPNRGCVCSQWSLDMLKEPKEPKEPKQVYPMKKVGLGRQTSARGCWKTMVLLKKAPRPLGHCCAKGNPQQTQTRELSRRPSGSERHGRGTRNGASTWDTPLKVETGLTSLSRFCCCIAFACFFPDSFDLFP